MLHKIDFDCNLSCEVVGGTEKIIYFDKEKRKKKRNSKSLTSIKECGEWGICGVVVVARFLH
jgi:hypothetical protein